MTAQKHTSHFFQSAIGKLVAQFLIITVGGALITALFTALFQFFGSLRDAKTEQAKFERANFLEVRATVDRLITNRLVAMERILSNLKDIPDLGAAKKIRATDYANAVSEWNLKAHPLLPSLQQLDPESCSDQSDQCPTDPDIKSTSHCLEDRFYCTSEDKLVLPQPVSVHYAFFYASKTLVTLMNSPWVDCINTVDKLLDGQLDTCMHGQAEVDGKTDPAPILECIDKRHMEHNKYIENICGNKEGHDLIRKLSDQLGRVTKLWSILTSRFSAVEAKKGWSLNTQ
jgi:hypothetical protein